MDNYLKCLDIGKGKTHQISHCKQSNIEVKYRSFPYDLYWYPFMGLKEASIWHKTNISDKKIKKSRNG